MDSLIMSLLREDSLRYFERSDPMYLKLLKSFHNPGFLFCLAYRIERSLLTNNGMLAKGIGSLLYPFYFYFTYYVLSYHIEPFVEIDGGLFLHNKNIVITDRTKIGSNFTCMGEVTIGTDFIHTNPKIVIGKNVKIGSGAKVIAHNDLTIADGVLIGANAVVVKNIPTTGSTWVGVPARKVRKKNK